MCDDFHDRFIIVNGVEYYHFGHSLKGLQGERVSRYSKMIDEEEISKLKALIDKHWLNSTNLFPQRNMVLYCD